jgi:hypothetical protein
LDKLPLFAKAGSIIPMYQQMNFDNERPADTLTLDVWPGPDAEFTLIEDEGSNREYRTGKTASTTLTATCDSKNRVTEIRIAAAKGDYTGRPASRHYIIQIHGRAVPDRILVQGKKMAHCSNAADFSAIPDTWFFNPDEKRGTLFIQTPGISTATDAILTLQY